MAGPTFCGGISIVFSTYFRQLRPAKCECDGILYAGVMNGLFEGSINTVIVFETGHRIDMTQHLEQY